MQGQVEAWVETHPTLSFLAPPGFRSWTVSAITLPSHVSAQGIAAKMKHRGWTIGTGLDADTETVIRIGHMGDLQTEHLEALLAELSVVVGMD